VGREGEDGGQLIDCLEGYCEVFRDCAGGGCCGCGWGWLWRGGVVVGAVVHGDESVLE